MKKKYFTDTCFCVLCTFCNEESNDKQEEDVSIKEKTLLWRIEGNGLKKASYIYGTYTTHDSRAHQFADSVLSKLDACQAAVFETIDFEAMNESEQINSISLPQIITLKNILSKADYDFVRKKIIEISGDDQLAYDSIKPFYTIKKFDMKRSINEMEYNVPDFLYDRAKQANKKTIGFETTEAFNKRMDEISLQDQGRLLVNYFKDFHKDSVYGFAN